MTIHAEADLESELAAAAAHDRSDRIPVWRDRLAAHGADAVDAVGPWVGDPDRELFRFANRVIKKVAESGGPARDHAVGTLMAIGRTDLPDENRRDLEQVLREMNIAKMPRPNGPTARRANRGEDVLPSEEREATVIHGRETLADGRTGIRFTVMAQAGGSHFGVPVSARAELGLGHGDDVYLEVRRTGRFMPATGAIGELLFKGVTGMRSGPEVYHRQSDESTKGLDKIGPNEVIEVVVAQPPM
jgi:hypothetical protein